MNWIKKNWLSLIAIMLSITAWFKFERIAITSHSIEWCFPIGIAIISLGVTVVLGVQIWNALSIDRRVKSEVKLAKSEIDESFADQQDRMLYFMSIINEVSQARMDIIEKDYDEALFNYLCAIEAAGNADLPDMAKAFLDAIINFIIPTIEKEGIKITISEGDKAKYYDILRTVNDNRAIDLIVYLRAL